MTDSVMIFPAVPYLWYFEMFGFVFMDSVVILGIMLCSQLLGVGVNKLSQSHPFVGQPLLLLESPEKVERDRDSRVVLSEEEILPFHLCIWNLALCLLWYAFRYNSECQLVYRVPSALQGSSACLGFHSRLPFF
jgi:hypothetical protein